MSDQFPPLVSLSLEGVLPKPFQTVSLSTADAEAAQAILGNSPLPLRDVTFLSCQWDGGSTETLAPVARLAHIPADFRFQPSFTITSPLDFAAAMDAAGLHPSWPGPCIFPEPSQPTRYVVLTASGSAEGGATIPIPTGAAGSLTVESAGTANGGMAFLAAVPCFAGSHAQLAPVFGALQLPWELSGAHRLPLGTAVVARLEGKIQAATAAKFGYNLNWLREVANGRLSTDYGVKLDASAAANIRWQLGGSFVAVMNTSEDGWLRLRLFKQKDSALRTRVEVAMGATAQGAAAREPQQLLSAFLGLLPQQWLSQLSAGLREPRLPARIADAVRDLGIPQPVLSAVLGSWRELDPEVAALLWDQLDKADVMREIAAWAGRICSELNSPEALRGAVAKMLAHQPAFQSSPRNRFLEALLGEAMASALAAPQWERARHEAAKVTNLLNGEGWVEALQRLHEYAAEHLAAPRIWEALQDLSRYRSLPGWVRELIELTLPELRSPDGLVKLAKLFPQLDRLASDLIPRAREALTRRYGAQLSYVAQSEEFGSSLLDCSFAYDEAGMGALRRALSGDFVSLLFEQSPAVRLHSSALLAGLSRQARLELHLPFLDRKQWERRIDAIAGMRVEVQPDGRLMVYSVDASSRLSQGSSYQSVLALAGALPIGKNAGSPDFTLSFSDSRALPAPQIKRMLLPILEAYEFPPAAALAVAGASSRKEPLEVTFWLRVPGNAVSVWTEAPGERDDNFRYVYSRVSLAVQAALRRWLPYVYFSRLERYHDLQSAFSLIVYQSSRPTVGTSKFQLTYDAICPVSLERALRSSLGNLRREMKRISQVLEAAGNKRIALYYAPEHAERVLRNITTSPRLFQSLLVADAFFMKHLVDLGNTATKLRSNFDRNPVQAVKNLLNFSEEFVKTFHGKLRRLYGGLDFLPFGPLILMEASKALHAALHEQACPIEGGIELGANGGDGAPLTTSFVNTAYRPRISR